MPLPYNDMENIEKFQPKNLDDAINFLIENILKNPENLEFINKHRDNEDDFIGELHHFFGRNLRNMWYLWWFPEHKYESWPVEKPSIVAWFNRHDIFHADDMSSIILTSTHRKWFNLPIELSQQIERYHRHWMETRGNINPLLKEN